jgi:hypothetical protein
VSLRETARAERSDRYVVTNSSTRDWTKRFPSAVRPRRFGRPGSAVAVLTAAPAFGWAVNHFSSSSGPQYATTLPVEMAAVYGNVFGLVGYAIGSTVRRTVR